MFDQIIENRAGNPRFESFLDEDIGTGLVAQRGAGDPDRMLRPRGNLMVQIGAKDELLIVAATLDLYVDCDKRSILDHDAAPFGGRHEPKRALFVPREHGREKLDQFDPVDGRAFMVPGPVARDPDVEGLVPKPAGCRGLGLERRVERLFHGHARVAGSYHGIGNSGMCAT